MADLFFKTATAQDEAQTTHTFSYWLITRQNQAGRFVFEDYGVRVSSANESVCLPSITHSYTLIQHLLKLLQEHAVSPVCVYDVVADWTKENHLPQPRLQQVADVG